MLARKTFIISLLILSSTAIYAADGAEQLEKRQAKFQESRLIANQKKEEQKALVENSPPNTPATTYSQPSPSEHSKD